MYIVPYTIAFVFFLRAVSRPLWYLSDRFDKYPEYLLFLWTFILGWLGPNYWVTLVPTGYYIYKHLHCIEQNIPLVVVSFVTGIVLPPEYGTSVLVHIISQLGQVSPYISLSVFMLLASLVGYCVSKGKHVSLLYFLYSLLFIHINGSYIYPILIGLSLCGVLTRNHKYLTLHLIESVFTIGALYCHWHIAILFSVASIASIWIVTDQIKSNKPIKNKQMSNNIRDYLNMVKSMTRPFWSGFVNMFTEYKELKQAQVQFSKPQPTSPVYRPHLPETNKSTDNSLLFDDIVDTSIISDYSSSSY